MSTFEEHEHQSVGGNRAPKLSPIGEIIDSLHKKSELISNMESAHRNRMDNAVGPEPTPDCEEAKGSENPTSSKQSLLVQLAKANTRLDMVIKRLAHELDRLPSLTGE